MTISRSIRTLFVAISLTLPSFTLAAGGLGGFVAKIWGSMMNPDPKVDSNYVYQPYKGIGASLGYQLNGNGSSMNTKMDFNDGMGQTSYELQMDMNPRKSHNASIRGGYGPIYLGYSQEFGKNTKKDKSNSFSFVGRQIFVDIQHKKYYVQPSVSLLATAGDGSIAQYNIDDCGFACNKILMMNFIYALDGKRFSFIAAQGDRRAVQRKSAGSWIIGAKYYMGSTAMDPQDLYAMSLIDGAGIFDIHQASIGGGYSFNWVLFHHDALSSKDFRGLGNLTFNITAMPIVTLYSDLVTKQYIVGADGFYTDQARENSFSSVSHIQPNFTLQSGLYGQLNSLYFTLKGNFNYLNFSSDPRRIYEGSTYYDITQNGHYLWWSAAFEISYRF